MRKYNNKTKKTMIVLIILFIIIIVIFSLFLKKSIEVGKTAYTVESGAILFDYEKNMITTTTQGTIKVKWAGDYYLLYNDKSYNLGSHSVVYDSNTGNISLYGQYYEVNSDEKVEVIKGENKIKSSVNSKFYKLADRKYLIIDRTIQSDDSSFVTSNYLIIHLDKLGNATLLNDKTSYKTIQPTVLRTSSYTFDIANEKLNFGGEDIDLKKIIGSTNEYDEDTYDLNSNITEGEQEGEGGTGTGDGTGDGSGGSGGGVGGSGTGDGTGDGTGATGDGSGGTGTTGTGEGSGDVTAGVGLGTGVNGNGTTAGSNSEFNNNYNSGISDATVQEIINATKNTSVIRITPGIDTISVDYVVYDPSNEYKSVFVEVEDTTSSNVNVVFLSKTDTNLLIRDLTPNVYYNLKFKYTYYDEKGNLKEYTFDEVGLHTNIPQIVLSVTKIVGNKLYYKISFDSNYTVTGGNVNLYLNDQFTNISGSIPSNKGNVSEISGNDCYIDLSTLNLSTDKENLLSLRLVSLSFNTYTINPGISYNFKY